jgi:uncharacterized RDD family membrane protein YckC
MSLLSKQALTERPRLLAAGITLLVAVIAITPLCGLLFQCGCDWPWDGLDRKCNFHQPQALQRCPWCVEMVWGILACAMAITAGTGTTFFSKIIIGKSERGLRVIPSDGYGIILTEMILRIVAGLIVFVCIALFTAVLAAFSQGYSAGIGLLLF